MLELKYTIPKQKIHREGLIAAECRRQMKVPKNLMIYQQNLSNQKNRGKQIKEKNRALEIWGTVSKNLIFTTLESLKERSNEIGSE